MPDGSGLRRRPARPPWPRPRQRDACRDPPVGRIRWILHPTCPGSRSGSDPSTRLPASPEHGGRAPGARTRSAPSPAAKLPPGGRHRTHGSHPLGASPAGSGQRHRGTLGCPGSQPRRGRAPRVLFPPEPPGSAAEVSGLQRRGASSRALGGCCWAGEKVLGAARSCPGSSLFLFLFLIFIFYFFSSPTEGKFFTEMQKKTNKTNQYFAEYFL